MITTIKSIASALVIVLSCFAANAQQQIIDTNPEGAETTVKTETRVEPRASRQSPTGSKWTGFYVGGFGGYSNVRANAVTTTANLQNSGYFHVDSIKSVNAAGNQRLKSNTFSGGGTFGYNYQRNRLVLGAEVDFGSNRSNRKVTSTGTYPCCLPSGFEMTQTVKSNWLMTARPRIGIATDKVLIYATGGVAVSDVDYSEVFTDNYGGKASQSGSFKKTKAGWVAGAGVEFQAASRLSVKAEYLVNQFPRTSTTSNNLKEGQNLYPATVFAHSTDLKSHSLRFGINYHF